MNKKIFLLSLIIIQFLVVSHLSQAAEQITEGTISGKISEINLRLIKERNAPKQVVGLNITIKNKKYFIRYEDTSKFGLNSLIDEYEKTGKSHSEKYIGRIVTIKYLTEIDFLWQDYLVTSLKWH